MEKIKTHHKYKIHNGFKISAVIEQSKYSIYLSPPDKNQDENLNLKIIENASSRGRALEKAKELIDQISWEIFIYSPLTIYIGTWHDGWIFKIVKEKNTLLIKNGFVDRQDAILLAFIRADLEWQKLEKK